MTENSNPYGLKPYVPPSRPATAAIAPLVPEVRIEPKSGLRYYADIAANTDVSREHEAPSLVSRIKDAFTRWFNGEDQMRKINAPKVETFSANISSLRWVDGRSYSPELEELPVNSLQRYEDILADQKRLACENAQENCSNQLPLRPATPRTR